jgi:rhamnogalacturonan acetylesterase
MIIPSLDVIIEFGHNDGGSPDTSTDADVYGTNNAVTEMVKLPNGAVELVHTFG